MIKLEDWYQFQPWHIKLYRQIRYTPKAFILAVWTYLTYSEAKLKKNEMT